MLAGALSNGRRYQSNGCGCQVSCSHFLAHIFVCPCIVGPSAQLKKNIIAAYTAETYFGGHGHSVLNTKLRNLKECPPLTPAAQLLHHAVSDLAATPEYGYDGVAYRAMRLAPDLVDKYKVHQDTTLNLFSWPGFTSCTRDAETCLGFVDDWDLNVVLVVSCDETTNAPK